MDCAENLKNLICENFEIFTESDVLIGSIDLSRYEKNNLCVIIPEKTEITETYIDGSFKAETRFTISMMFRGKKHSECVRTMEETAVNMQRLLISDFSLGSSVSDIIPGEIKYFYDCGTVEHQASGLDIELTIREEIK
ncbi:MAG: hypothetical protein II098_02405 [Treponema sp.]|nr:hypothetical protein [Treponema sp.]